MNKMDDIKKYIGARINEKREALEYSQEVMSQLTGLTRNSLINIEAGRHGTSAGMLYLFCRILKCTPNDLFPPVESSTVVFDIKTVTVKRKKKIVKARLSK